MKFYGVRVYDMCESIVASGLPMKKTEYTPEEFEWEVENLEYWLDNGSLIYLYNQTKNENYNRTMPNKIDIFEDRAELITMDNYGNETGRFIIDHESVPIIIKYKWSVSKGYCVNHLNGISLHRYLALDKTELEDGSIMVDHIDKNTFNNKLNNLRITDNTNNVRNSSLSKNNTSGIIGVNYRKDRNKWRAFIMVNKKQISLGLFDNIEDAIKARLQGELKYFGEFAPQIELFDRYGIEKPEITTCEKHSQYNLFKAWKHFKRAFNLCGAKPSSGHDCMAKGMAVHVNIKADQSFWLQFERYHHQDTISSMSTMHCLCKFEKLNEMFSPYTDPRSIAICNEYIEIYNNDPTLENFQKVIHNCPEGIELTRRIETNYLQLKTMFSQRKNHKMFAWSKDFKKLIDSLPYFYEFTGINKED